jgi:hypothetical protein
MTTDADRERRLEELFGLAREFPAPERDAFLERHCQGDGALRARLAALLAEDDERTVDALAADVVHPPAAGERRIGPYRLLEVLGEGGMGTVHLAEQDEPVHRRVALKTMRLGAGSAQAFARFELECRTMALLEHPNLARIYDAGRVPSGLPWLAMEYVPGPAITAYCDDTRATLEDRVDLFLSVCDGVQHAHRRGILHCDLKPSNILVHSGDAGPVAKVIDFGIARLAGGPIQARQVVGTPRYMSPEQADPERTDDVDTRTDVWALGATLHELLAGPVGADAAQVAALRRTTPAALARRLAGDLCAILERAMDPDPERRYGSAGELAADLRRHRARVPVLARSATPAYRLDRFVRRHTALSVLGALALFALLFALVGLTTANRQEARRLQELEQRRETDVARVEFLQELLFDPASALTLLAMIDEHESRLSARLEGRPGPEAAIRTTLGWLRLLAGDPEGAREELRRSEAIRSALQDPDPFEVYMTLEARLRAERLLAPGGAAQPWSERCVAAAVAVTRQTDGDLAAAASRVVEARGGTDAAARLQGLFARLPSDQSWSRLLPVLRVAWEVGLRLHADPGADAGPFLTALEALLRERLDPASPAFVLALHGLVGLVGPERPDLVRELRERVAELPSEHWLRADEQRD